MMQLIQLPESAVFLHDGHAVTTSLRVSEIFGKRHDNVVRDIKKMVGTEGGGLLNFEESTDEGLSNFGQSSEFGRSNFRPSSYLNEQNKEQPMYELTKNGFTFLVMGFTGPQSTQFKIAYINRFDEMEAVLMQEFKQPAVQVEKYWFARRPLWPLIRPRVLLGEAYRAIAAALEIKPGRVARAVKSMIKVGLLDPCKVAGVQHGPAKRAALRHCAGWGKPAQPSPQLNLFDLYPQPAS